MKLPEDTSATLKDLFGALPSAASALNSIPIAVRPAFERRMCATFNQALSLQTTNSRTVTLHGAAVMASSEVSAWYYVPWELLMQEPHLKKISSRCDSGGIRAVMDYAWGEGDIQSVYYGRGAIEPTNTVMIERYLNQVFASAKSERVGFFVLDEGIISMSNAMTLAKRINIPGSRVVIGNRDTLKDATWFSKINAYESRMGLEVLEPFRKIPPTVIPKATELPTHTILERVNKIARAHSPSRRALS